MRARPGRFTAATSPPLREVLGMAQSLGGQPGMTGTLTVRYRKPTPLHTDLRVEAQIDRLGGRKTFTTGQRLAGDLLSAKATPCSSTSTWPESPS